MGKSNSYNDDNDNNTFTREIIPERDLKNDYNIDIKKNAEKQENSQSALPLSIVTPPPSLLQPPENFANVAGQIYRSSFPRPGNFPFLNKLHLKSIVVLIPEEYPQENLEFLKTQNITIFQVPISGNKEPFINIPQSSITEILQIVLDPANHPLLIHCNRGKHRTGCVVGCIRKLQNWSLTMIFDEYRRFAAPKIRSLDQQFIELYEEDKIVEIASKRSWLPVDW